MNMKKILVAVAAAGLLLASCSEKHEDVNQRILNTPETAVRDTLGYSIGWEDLHRLPVEFVANVNYTDSVTLAISFESDKRITWTIEGNPTDRPAFPDTYFSVTPLQGRGSGSFFIKVPANTTGSARSGRFLLNLVERDSTDEVVAAITHNFIVNQK